jgi:ribokinase
VPIPESGSQIDVFGFGQCCLDHLGQVEEYPPPDAKCEVSDLVIQGGGPVATTLVALARWGVACAIAGMVGDDRFGAETRRSLDIEGIDTTGLLTRENAASQVAFIVAESGSGRRNIFWRPPTGPPPGPDEIDLGLLRRARVFHTDGLFPEMALFAARTAREAGVEVSVDAGSMRDGMLDLAATADHFIASSTFARSFAGKNDPMSVCRRLAELGPSVVAVTLGKHGYVALAEGREIRSLGYEVGAVDTTGCGDVFHAGYVYGLLRGWKVNASLDFAAWAASQVALRLGGRAGIPSADEWRGFDSEDTEVSRREHLDRIGYVGWIGCEYASASTTVEGLGWIESYLETRT